ncbi:hypothetical protein D3C80_1732540 [compost metagenome]
MMFWLGDLVFYERNGMVEQGLAFVDGIAGHVDQAFDPGRPVQVIGLYHRFIHVL